MTLRTVWIFVMPLTKQRAFSWNVSSRHLCCTGRLETPLDYYNLSREIVNFLTAVKPRALIGRTSDYQPISASRHFTILRIHFDRL